MMTQEKSLIIANLVSIPNIKRYGSNTSPKNLIKVVDEVRSEERRVGHITTTKGARDSYTTEGDDT